MTYRYYKCRGSEIHHTCTSKSKYHVRNNEEMKCKEATCKSACTGGCNKEQKKRLVDPLVWMGRCTGAKSHNTLTGLDEEGHPHSSFCKFDPTAMVEAMNRSKLKEEGAAATSTSQVKQNQIRRTMLMAEGGPEMKALAYSLVGERECVCVVCVCLCVPITQIKHATPMNAGRRSHCK